MHRTLDANRLEGTLPVQWAESKAWTNLNQLSVSRNSLTGRCAAILASVMRILMQTCRCTTGAAQAEQPAGTARPDSAQENVAEMSASVCISVWKASMCIHLASAGQLITTSIVAACLPLGARIL